MVKPYLWQRDGWPGLRWSDERVSPALAETRRAQGRLLGRATRLGVELGSELHADNVVLDAVTSAAVEGEKLDPEGVRSSVARQLGLPIEVDARRSRGVDGLVEMLLDATGRAGRPLTAERLHGWHAGLFPTGYSGIRPITVAGWRTGETPMRVVSGGPDREVVHFEAPPSPSIPDEMSVFLSWWKGPRDDGLVRAALAHLWFVTLHPYDDGNGRLARALTDMALAQDEQSPTRLYSMSAQIEADRAAYYAHLEDAQKGDQDVTNWVVWFLEALGKAIEDADQRLDGVLARSRFWQVHAQVPLTARQIKVLKCVVREGPGGFDGGLTTRKYAALTGVSRATAQRELADLLRKGVLVALPGRGRSSAYAPCWP